MAADVPALAVATEAAVAEATMNPQEMALRLAEMKQKMQLLQSFFKEVMIEGQDYGIIPGTEKPTLYKSGAEKLCEFYGFAITIKDLKETMDPTSGYYRAIVTVALVHRRTGTVVAEGVGEANTYEGRYRWRWVPEWKLPAGVDKEALYSEERKDRRGQTYRMYRVENEDLCALWNTVLKMAKKRAVVDAALSATRSSGIFTQDIEDLQGWAQAAEDVEVTADIQDVTKAAAPERPAQKPNTTRPSTRPSGSKTGGRPAEQELAYILTAIGAKDANAAARKRWGKTLSAMTDEELAAHVHEGRTYLVTKAAESRGVDGDYALQKLAAGKGLDEMTSEEFKRIYEALTKTSDAELASLLAAEDDAEDDASEIDDVMADVTF